MVTITRHGGKRSTQEEARSLKCKPTQTIRKGQAPKKKIRSDAASNEIIVGIINILNIASADGDRFKDILDGFIHSQNAATMIEVAWRFAGGVKPRTKVEAHRQLVSAYNERATANFVKKKQV
tara:strand:+ start:866 stop:1234 length:369 start_codon:yes stop_codon:yes gene_type:complete